MTISVTLIVKNISYNKYQRSICGAPNTTVSSILYISLPCGWSDAGVIFTCAAPPRVQPLQAVHTILHGALSLMLECFSVRYLDFCSPSVFLASSLFLPQPPSQDSTHARSARMSDICFTFTLSGKSAQKAIRSGNTQNL